MIIEQLSAVYAAIEHDLFPAHEEGENMSVNMPMGCTENDPHFNSDPDGQLDAPGPTEPAIDCTVCGKPLIAAGTDEDQEEAINSGYDQTLMICGNYTVCYECFRSRRGLCF